MDQLIRLVYKILFYSIKLFIINFILKLKIDSIILKCIKFIYFAFNVNTN